eukprot:TRINITY_DN15919_c0_g1_i1.p1 TRINITY_DN15919_c0_g1~~TRINITY_DN15919_c0_g1_i1.p1  ORF type:complete len:992 (+),score=202.81 TRINITY_DN15919_c0_g1_i1:37-2976(+)
MAQVLQDVIPGNINWFQASATGVCDGLLVYGSKGRVVILNVVDDVYVTSAKAHDGRACVTGAKWLSFTRSERRGVVVTCGTDKAVKLWNVDATRGTIAQHQCFKLAAEATALDTTSDGLIVCGDKQGHLQLRNSGAKELFNKTFSCAVASLACCSSQNRAGWVAVGLEDGGICILNKSETMFHWRGPHTKSIQSLSWRATDRNGLYLASTGLDKKFVVWRMSELESTSSWTYQTYQLSVPSAEKGSSGAHSGQNRVWNVVAWCNLLGHQDKLYTAGNGSSTLLAWDMEGALESWAAERLPPLRGTVSPKQLNGHSRCIFTVSFVAGPKPVILTTSMERRIIKWCIQGHKSLQILPSVTQPPSCLQFSDGRLVFGEKSIVVWSLPQCHLSNPSNHDRSPHAVKEMWNKISSPVTTVSIHKDEIAFGTRDGDIGVVSRSQKNKSQFVTSVLVSTGSQVHAVAWLPDGKILGVGQSACVILHRSEKSTSKIYVTDAVKEALQDKTIDTAVCSHRLLVATRRSKVTVFHVRDTALELAHTTQDEEAVECCAVHTERDLLIATGGGEGAVTVFASSQEEGMSKSTLRMHKRKVTSVSWQAKTSALCSSGADGKVFLWNGNPSDLQATAVLHWDFPLRSAVFSPFNDSLVYAADDQTIKVFHTAAASPPAAAGHKRKLDAVTEPPPAEPHLSVLDWFRGVSGGGDRSLVDGSDDLTLELMSGHFVGVENMHLDDLRRRIRESSSLQPDVRAVLLCLAGDFQGAAQLPTSAACAALCVALSRADGEEAWMSTLHNWRQKLQERDLQAALDLCVGQGDTAAELLGQAQCFGGLAHLLREWGHGVTAARAALQEVASSDIPPAKRSSALFALGRDVEAAAALAQSNDVRQLKRSLEIHATQAVADKYAARWILGEDPETLLPPDGSGGVHCAAEARKVLVLDREGVRQNVADHAKVVKDLTAWLTRASDMMPRKVEHVVNRAVDWLSH